MTKQNNMAAYNLMIKTNHHLIRGGTYSDCEKADIVQQLRESRLTDGRKRTFNNPYWYPEFYIPPHNNGKRLQTVIPMSPKTHIVADNAYEFEIIRLLHQFQPDDEVSHMIKGTINRLKQTCFGYEGCHYAECFEAGLTVLRFLSFAATHDKDWIQKQIAVYNNHFADSRRHSGVLRYYWLILSDMPFDIAQPEILRQKHTIIEHINRGYVIKNGNEDVLLCVMRNVLARLPEYSYIRNRQPFVDDKNGKLRFNMDECEVICLRDVDTDSR